MTTRAITHRRLAINGRVAEVRCQQLDAQRSLVGPAEQLTLREVAELIDRGEEFEFWPRVGALRVPGGSVVIRHEADGTLRLVEDRGAGYQILDLPGF